MTIERQRGAAPYIRFCKKVNGCEVARARLYIHYNENRSVPYGYVSGVFVEDAYRHQGFATELYHDMFSLSRELRLSYVVAGRRFFEDETITGKVIKFFTGLGFRKYGNEFRIDFGYPPA